MINKISAMFCYLRLPSAVFVFAVMTLAGCTQTAVVSGKCPNYSGSDKLVLMMGNIKMGSIDPKTGGYLSIGSREGVCSQVDEGTYAIFQGKAMADGASKNYGGCTMNFKRYPCGSQGDFSGMPLGDSYQVAKICEIPILGVCL